MEYSETIVFDAILHDGTTEYFTDNMPDINDPLKVHAAADIGIFFGSDEPAGV